MKCIRRSNFDLFLDCLCRIEPMFDIIRISKLQAKEIFLDKIQRIKNLFIQIICDGLFLFNEKIKLNKLMIFFSFFLQM